MVVMGSARSINKLYKRVVAEEPEDLWRDFVPSLSKASTMRFDQGPPATQRHSKKRWHRKNLGNRTCPEGDAGNVGYRRIVDRTGKSIPILASGRSQAFAWRRQYTRYTPNGNIAARRVIAQPDHWTDAALKTGLHNELETWAA